jgi:voltage-gated potassium channel
MALLPDQARQKLHAIIFESNTKAGKAFDVGLLIAIIISILIVMLDSIASLHIKYGDFFLQLEWFFTFLFTIEYLLRLLTLEKPLKYMLSFIGLIDLLAILPSFLSLFVAGTQSLMVLRALRLLRIFRIFKLTHFLGEMRFLRYAIRASMNKITIFMLVVFTVVIILGSMMYLIENGQNGFNSIPDSIYWAIVTITTVGYGDISPVTPLGKLFASVIMFIGYAIIAVPTGIVTSEMTAAMRRKKEQHETCPACGREGHDIDANYCKHCGHELNND